MTPGRTVFPTIFASEHHRNCYLEEAPSGRPEVALGAMIAPKKWCVSLLDEPYGLNSATLLNLIACNQGIRYDRVKHPREWRLD